jgi:hypothetical protein
MTKNYTIETEIKHSRGHLPVKVIFGDGRTYILHFFEPDAAKKAMNGRKLSYLALPGFIMIDKATIDRVENMLEDLVKSGFFNAFIPTKDDGGCPGE